MNKETEQWIEKNNPYGKEHPCKSCPSNVWNQCQINTSDCERYKERISIQDGWTKGAKAMAKHLTSQPPTDEQIDRFLALYNEYCHVPSAALKIYPTAKEFIIKKWNDDYRI